MTATANQLKTIKLIITFEEDRIFIYGFWSHCSNKCDQFRQKSSRFWKAHAETKDRQSNTKYTDAFKCIINVFCGNVLLSFEFCFYYFACENGMAVRKVVFFFVCLFWIELRFNYKYKLLEIHKFNHTIGNDSISCGFI